MSIPLRLFHGDYGRVALLQMDAPLVSHAHQHCHLLLKAAGPDTAFLVRGKLCPLTDDNAVLINAWEEHAYLHELKGEATNTVLLALYLEPSWLAKFSQFFANSHHPHFFKNSSTRLSDAQKQSIEKVVMELWWSDSISSERLENLLLDLTLSFVDPRDAINPHFIQSSHLSTSFMDPRIRRAMQMMKSSIDAAHNLAEVAQTVNLSRSHFFELFRRCSGLSPLVYANVIKMDFALNALASPNVSLIDIGEELGFSAQSHFTRFFKQHQGVVPSLYRRQIETTEIKTIEKKSDDLVNRQTVS